MININIHNEKLKEIVRESNVKVSRSLIDPVVKIYTDENIYTTKFNTEAEAIDFIEELQMLAL